MKLLFVTCAYPIGSEKLLEEINKGALQSVQANTFQWAIIEGLEKNEADYQVVSYPSLSCFPLHNKRLITPRIAMKLREKTIGSMEPFFNFHLLASYSVGRRLYRYAKKWVEDNLSNDKLTILVYGLSPYLLKPLLRLKEDCPSVRISVIVTDLVEDEIVHIAHPSVFRRWKKASEARAIKTVYPFIDRFVLLTKQMEERIPEASGKNIVMEGLWAEHDYLPVQKNGNVRTLFYAGTLGRHSCVDKLLEAFMMTSNADFRLVICGAGEFQDLVEEALNKDGRIIFKHFVSREEVLALQRNSTALINPRNSSVKLTRFSFPSKTIECMTSGTPFIGYRLPGIPDEYYPYMYVLEDDSTDSLSKMIETVLSLPQQVLDQKARDAYDFIRENKNAARQVQRLLEFL